MKVCSLYGAGFYYIPGTDICMKIGGYVRYQLSTGIGDSISFGPFATFGTSTGGFNNRNTGIDLAQRVRVIVSQDTRQQTAYGTLRTYLILGWTHDTPQNTTAPSAPGVYFNRGFIQIAGFTFGKATSFFDFASTAAVAYNAGFVATSDTGDAGQIVGSYTWQLGNGVSGTIGIEQARRAGTVYAGAANLAAFGIGAASAGAGFVAGTAVGSVNLGGLNAGTQSRPDIVGNLRVDQAWGSAQFSAALHDNSVAYYGLPAGTGVLAGHPDDKWGWAIAGGLRVNTPWIGAGDYFQTQITYAQGATKYASNSGPVGNGIAFFSSGANFGLGFGEDAVFGGGANCATGGNPVGAAGGAGQPAAVACNFGNTIELTTAFSVFASYEHFWTPALRTSLYGSYLDISHNGNANGMICSSLLTVGQRAGGMQCNADFQTWAIGSRSQWNVTKDFYVGIDVIYQKLQTATINNGAPFVPSALAAGLLAPAGTVFSTQDQDAVSVTWRVHRDIVP